MTAKPDTIKMAIREANSYNRKRKRKAADAANWHGRMDKARAHEQDRETFKKALADAKRKLRHEMRKTGVYISFTDSTGHFITVENSGIKATLIVRYKVLHGGFEISRAFTPTCMEDVEVESWRLFVILDAVKPFSGKHRKTCEACSGKGWT